MVKIEHTPTFSKVTAEDEVIDLLSENLRYEKKANRYTKASYGKQYLKLFNRRFNTFPSGLLYLVEHVLQQEGIEYEVKETVPKASPRGDMLGEIEESLPYTFRKSQWDAIVSCIHNKGGIVESPTASGKSLMIASLIKRYALPTVILVFNINQATTVKKELSLLDIPYTQISGSDGVKKFLKHPWKKSVVIITAKTLYKHKKALENDLSEAELLIIDEVHKVAAKTHYAAAMSVFAPLRFGFTATPSGRTDNADLKVRGVVGRTIYRIENKELTETGVIAEGKCTFYKVHNTVSGDDWSYLLEHGIVRNSVRNDTIVSLVKKHKDALILILVSRIIHGDLLNILLTAEGVSCVFAHGSESIEDREHKINLLKEEEISCLIMSPFGSTGIDIPNANVLIMAGGGISFIETVQKVGRGLRRGKTGELKLYDFMDCGSSVLSKHSIQRKKIYENLGILCEVKELCVD